MDDSNTMDLAAPGAEGMAVPERGRPGPAARPETDVLPTDQGEPEVSETDRGADSG